MNPAGQLTPASPVGDDGEPALFAVTADEPPGQLDLAGEFDLAGVEQFAACAAGLLENHVSDVCVDLGALRFIDASGLGALVGLNNTLATTGHAMTLSHVTPRLTRVFAVAGLSHLVTP